MPERHHYKTLLFSTSLLTFSLLSSHSHAKETVEDYLDLDLEDLLSVEITSVSKKKQRLSDAAAAVFVISQDDIRRSGVMSIPEALRMAPGIEVARIDANKWAISSRGFNSQYANKLLVLIDGRSVYTPAFSGVYWDAQDTLMEDIDRIEVVRGPGATLWGANAVNGVINIITKFAADTQGGMLTLGGGNQEKGFASFRYGTNFNENTQARFYGKVFKKDESTLNSNGSGANDDWKSQRAGFRLDSNPTEKDHWTFQGDIYENKIHQSNAFTILEPSAIDPASISSLIPAGTFIPAIGPGFTETIQSRGFNLLAHWQHVLSESESINLQMYYDHTNRNENLVSQNYNTFDIDFQHNVAIRDLHDITWGLAYRNISDKFGNTPLISATPYKQTQHIFSAFVQDQFELSPEQAYLTLGSKIEHNDNTGFEVQPSVRLLWKPDTQNSIWGSISRAVRTPSRLEVSSSARHLSGVVTTGNSALPIVPYTAFLIGNKDFLSEELLAYEVGYRTQPLDNLSIDIATYYNDYKTLRSSEVINPTTTQFDNEMSGYTVGAEIAVDWRPVSWWRIQSNYSTIKSSLKLNSDSQDIINIPVAHEQGSAPRHQLSVRTSMDFSDNWELDLWAHHVSQISVSSLIRQQTNIINDYTSLNARIGWKPSKALELSLVGVNLQGGNHLEFAADITAGLSDMGRSLYAQLRWNF